MREGIYCAENLSNEFDYFAAIEENGTSFIYSVNKITDSAYEILDMGSEEEKDAGCRKIAKPLKLIDKVDIERLEDVKKMRWVSDIETIINLEFYHGSHGIWKQA